MISLDDFKTGGKLRNFVTKTGLLDKIDKEGYNQDELLEMLCASITHTGIVNNDDIPSGSYEPIEHEEIITDKTEEDEEAGSSNDDIPEVEPEEEEPEVEPIEEDENTEEVSINDVEPEVELSEGNDLKPIDGVSTDGEEVSDEEEVIE